MKYPRRPLQMPKLLLSMRLMLAPLKLSDDLLIAHGDS